jgi:hypothetical protein
VEEADSCPWPNEIHARCGRLENPERLKQTVIFLWTQLKERDTPWCQFQLGLICSSILAFQISFVLGSAANEVVLAQVTHLVLCHSVSRICQQHFGKNTACNKDDEILK